jgi:hypothetical protein
MNPRSSIVALFLLAAMPLNAVAQSQRGVKDKSEVDPPSIRSVLSGTHTNADAVISQLVDVKPEIPLGPVDLLRGYESAMTAIAESTSAELSFISQAVRTGQISSEKAEYLAQEKYQLSMMQYQVLSTLHDSLEHDIAQAAALSNYSQHQDAPDTAGGVETFSARQTQFNRLE